MKKSLRTPVFWTNDDIWYGQARPMQRQLDFLAGFGLRATFFLIPEGEPGKTLDRDAELVSALKRALAAGHECHQHGLRHDAFECGVPDLFMLDYSAAEKARYTDERFQIEARHTLPALRQMLRAGQAICRRALGRPGRGFRPGWGAFCANLYRAVEREGYEWVSGRCASMTSWQWQLGHFQYPDQMLPVGYGPFRVGKLIEYPGAGDYAFNVQRKDIRRFSQLGWRQFQACRRLGVPFNVTSHWHGLERNGDAGYAVHELLLTRLQKSGQAEFLTMGEHHEQVKRRSWPRVSLDGVAPGGK